MGIAPSETAGKLHLFKAQVRATTMRGGREEHATVHDQHALHEWLHRLRQFHLCDRLLVAEQVARLDRPVNANAVFGEEKVRDTPTAMAGLPDPYSRLTEWWLLLLVLTGGHRQAAQGAHQGGVRDVPRRPRDRPAPRPVLPGLCAATSQRAGKQQKRRQRTPMHTTPTGHSVVQ